MQRLSWLALVVLFPIAIFAASGAPGGAAAPLAPLTPQQIQAIAAAVPRKARVKPAQPRRLLVFHRAEGYVHDSIPYANEAYKQLGERTGAYTAEFSDEMAVFTPERLARYDAVLFNNTTELRFGDPQHRAALLAFVAGGKGFAGVHAASDNFYGWPQAQELLGGHYHNHPWNANDIVFVKVDDPAHPIVAAFEGRVFSVRDEIYQITGPYSRERQRVLLSIDMSRPENARPQQKLVRGDNDFPIAWVKSGPNGKGRVFYSCLGHDPQIYSNPPILQHYLDGLQYVLGDLPADARPSR